MWRKRLKEMEKYNAKVGYGPINRGATEGEIQRLQEAMREKFGVELPEAYCEALRTINGLVFSGFYFYGVDRELLDNEDDETIDEYTEGLVDLNETWREAEWNERYLYFGERDISWYVYDLVDKRYMELDLPTGEKEQDFNSFDEMMDYAVDESLR